MSTVRVLCLLCARRPKDLDACEVVVHLAGADTHDRYAFTCPDCAVDIVRRADRAAIDALVRSGVRVTAGPLPPWERPGQAGPRCGGAQTAAPATAAASITPADVLLFRRVLADDAALASWLTG